MQGLGASRNGVCSAAAVCVLALGLASCSSHPSTTPTSSGNGGVAPVTSTPSSSGGSGQSTGVTAHSVTVGQVDDLSSPIPGLFKGAEEGTQAYFAYINSMGGVNGRKIHLDAQDSTFQGGQVATTTAAQTKSDFALVGGFTLLDEAEQPIIDLAHMPDVTISLSPGLVTDPNLYSPVPNSIGNYPLNFFNYFAKKYPQAVKKVGIIWENATASTTANEDAVESGMKAAGWKIVYDHGVGPFDTNFLPDIISMKAKGVKIFFSTELPDNYAATLAKQFQQQSFKAVNIEAAAYSAQLLKLAGSSANNMYIEQGEALYLGQDAKTVPAVALFDKWMRKVSSDPNFEIESIFGWTCSRALRPGPRPGRQPSHPGRALPGVEQGDVVQRRGTDPTERPRRRRALGLLPPGPGPTRRDQARCPHPARRVLLRQRRVRHRPGLQADRPSFAVTTGNTRPSHGSCQARTEDPADLSPRARPVVRHLGRVRRTSFHRRRHRHRLLQRPRHPDGPGPRCDGGRLARWTPGGRGAVAAAPRLGVVRPGQRCSRGGDVSPESGSGSRRAGAGRCSSGW